MAERMRSVFRAGTPSAMLALGVEVPASTWWVNVRTIDEGSWGSRGRVTSILDLLDTGMFTAERAAAIRAALS